MDGVVIPVSKQRGNRKLQWTLTESKWRQSVCVELASVGQEAENRRSVQPRMTHARGLGDVDAAGAVCRPA